MDDEVLQVYLYKLKDLDKVSTLVTINIVEKVPCIVFRPFLLQHDEARKDHSNVKNKTHNRHYLIFVR